jgi:hypothetical protein
MNSPLDPPRDNGGPVNQPAAPAAAHPASVYRRLVRDRRVSHGAFRLWHYLRDRADAAGECFPGQRLIAQEVGCDSHSLPSWIGELTRAGYLVISRAGPRRANRYRLLDGNGAVMRKPTALPASSGVKMPHGLTWKCPTRSDVEMPHVSNNKEVITRSKGDPPGLAALSGPERIGRERELERVEERIKSLRECAARNALQELILSPRERELLARLKQRRQELIEALGYVV